MDASEEKTQVDFSFRVNTQRPLHPTSPPHAHRHDTEITIITKEGASGASCSISEGSTRHEDGSDTGMADQINMIVHDSRSWW